MRFGSGILIDFSSQANEYGLSDCNTRILQVTGGDDMSDLDREFIRLVRLHGLEAMENLIVILEQATKGAVAFREGEHGTVQEVRIPPK